MGQANHFLITIMVGLDAVKNGAKKEDSFHTTWQPKDTPTSAERSRQYAIKSSLAWAVDNLDMYLRLCNRNPKLYQEIESQEIAETKHSVYNKFKCVAKNHPQIATNKKAFVDLLICWRNNLMHFDAENDLLWESEKYFKNIPDDDAIVNNYHLDSSSMLCRFRNGDPPTFKEVTTLISTTIHFVEELDKILLGDIQQDIYLENTLRVLVREDLTDLGVFSFRNTTPEKKIKKLKQLFKTIGIDQSFYNEGGESFLEKIAKMSKEELKENQYLKF